MAGRAPKRGAEPKRGVTPTPQAAAPLVLEGVLNGGASMVYHVLDEGDVRRIMALLPGVTLRF